MKKAKYIPIFLIIITIFQFASFTTSFAEANTITSENTAISTSSNTELATTNPVNTSKDITIYSPSCVLIEASTGNILYQKNANEVRYPASTTKIMTAILVLENCELTDVATVSHNAIHSIPADYVTCNIKEGEELTIESLLNVLLIPSANDAAIVLAEHVAGSVENFSELMNKKAKELGCTNTNFVNPNGVHDKKHVSTAYDLALIAQYAMENSTFRQIVQKTKYTLPSTNKYSKTDRTFTTTNNLLIKSNSTAKNNNYYADATGIKTGYTGPAGNCLVASAKRNNMEVISVVLGANTTSDGLSEKFLDTISLLDYAFDNYSIRTLQEENSVVQEVVVPWSTKETENLKVLAKDNISVLLSNDIDLSSIEPKIELDKLKSPIAYGSVIGNVSYTINGEVYSSELIAGNDVFSSNLLSLLLRIALIVVTLYLLHLLLKPKKKNNKTHKSHKSMSKKTKAKNKRSQKRKL